MSHHSPLSREELERLLEERSRDRSGPAWLATWRYWRGMGERLIEQKLHQKPLPGLFQRLLSTYRQHALQPSDDTRERFLEARADARSHLLEHAWRPAFRRYWKGEGMNRFTELSRQAVFRFPLDKRHGTHLRLLALLEGPVHSMADPWVREQDGLLLREEVAAIPFERWVMGRDAPDRAEPGKAEPGKAEPGKAEPGKAEPGKAGPGKAGAVPESMD
jgi:hypothetical protein